MAGFFFYPKVNKAVIDLGINPDTDIRRPYKVQMTDLGTLINLEFLKLTGAVIAITFSLLLLVVVIIATVYFNGWPTVIYLVLLFTIAAGGWLLSLRKS